MRQIACIGGRLRDCIVEIDSLEAVLEKLVKGCDEDCDCDDEE